MNYISIELFLKSGWPLYCPSRKPIKEPLPYTKNFPSSVFTSSKEPRVNFGKFFDLLSSLKHDGEVLIPKFDVVEGKITVSNIPC